MKEKKELDKVVKKMREQIMNTQKVTGSKTQKAKEAALSRSK